MYQLIIQAYGNPTPVLTKCENAEEAFAAAHKAMKIGHHKTKGLTVIIGPGSLLNVISEEEVQLAQRKADEACRSGGFIETGRNTVKPEDHILHIQMGQVPLPPLAYKTEEERDNAIEEGLKTGHIEYVFKQDHDHFFIMLGTGVMLMSIGGASFIDQRRKALAMQQKMQAEALEAAGGGSKIVLPFGLGRK
jgi:hypothetical protein